LRFGNASIPEHCPVCQGKTVISNANGKEFLYCENPQCAAKKLKGFEHFVKRDAINIEGLSEQSLEKFINRCFLKDFADLFTLEQYRDEILGAKQQAASRRKAPILSIMTAIRQAQRISRRRC